MVWINKRHIVKVWLQESGVDFSGPFSCRYVITLIDGSIVHLDKTLAPSGMIDKWPEFTLVQCN
jgi:hypothetical protein